MKYQYTVEEREEILTDPWLTDRERNVFVLCYMRGWHIEDIAEDIGVSRKTVDNILRGIRDRHPPKMLH